MEVAWLEIVIAPLASPPARNGIDIIRKPAIVAVSALTASMPSMVDMVMPPGAVAAMADSSRPMMNMCRTAYSGPQAAR
jgi:hypothetical protein